MKKYLEKHTKIKEKNLKYDFLPSMLEIIEKPENKMSEFIILLITTLLIVTVIWAALFKIDITVTAYGSLNAEGNIIPINNAYAGSVSEICVKDGDYVEKGDILLRVDSSDEQLAVEQFQEDIEILEIQKEMYERIYKEESLEEFDCSIYGEYAPVAEAICMEQKSYRLQLEQYDIVRQTSEDKKLIDNQKDNFVIERELEILQYINTLKERIRQKEAELNEQQNIIADKSVIATASGNISNWQINSEGYYISNGQNIAYIIPEEACVIFEAYISTSDIEYVHVGDSVKVKLAALDNSQYEIVQGEVKTIGPLAVAVDGLGNVYPVEVALQDVPEDMLHIGSEGRCDIIVGQRTVLDYFLEPFIEGIQESLKES
ncbi:MAG: HlyD family efflux transporter periplasmic adaptor subunit [Lachnospiraceae bacterium]|nr:HlyD family efflux transporter periplasmic adaptor subunit [Lachnospiraceae bacterium]